MSLARGTKLGPYEVLAPLGAGGMGEVYRANDPRLDREVAIKIVPERFAEDSEALVRFAREAKAVGALSHPNILAIHDVGADHGISYVVMELLNGETLRGRLRHAPLAWRKAVEAGAALADGLAAAHAKGIVHRDLKPENIFLTTDAVVKILDFGLARMQPVPAADDSDIPTVTVDTRPGTVLGTVNYMSPEQVRGRKADACSDIFSLGCVLCEMVTGTKAFSGETAAETMTAILKHQPPLPAESGVQSPAELDRVITRCLEKKPEDRFQSARDLAFTLRTILSDSGSSRVIAAGAAPAAGKAWWLAAGMALAVVAAGLYLFLPRRDPGAGPARTIKALTSLEGVEGHPSWSPDGGFIAFTHNPTGPPDIFVMSATGGDPIRRTNTTADDLSPRWSPDNRWLAFVSGRDTTAAIYLIPPLAGAERKLVETGISCAERVGDAGNSMGATPWSPDGRELLFSRLQPSGELAVWKIDLETRRQKLMTHPAPGTNDLSASWSFDGRRIAFNRHRGGRASIWLLPAEGGEPHLLLGDEHQNGEPAWWPDDRRIVFASDRGGAVNLWEIDVTTRCLRQLTTGSGRDRNPVVSRTGRIAYFQFSHQTDLYVTPVEGGTEERLTFNTKDNFAARFSPDGNKIVYHGTRTGNQEIWLLDRSTGAERQLTSDPHTDIYPDWSPDGREIVFVSNREGSFQMWCIDTDGENLRRLSEQAVSLRNVFNAFVMTSVGPRWSPDGKAIGYLAPTEKGHALWVMQPDGTDARPHLYGVLGFDWYRDSGHVVYSRFAGDGSHTMEMHAANLETGQEALLLSGPHAELIVAPDGSAVAYCRSLSHYDMDLYVQRLDSPAAPGELPRPAGQPQRLTRGKDRWHVHNGGWSPERREIVYTRDTDSSDIYVIESGNQ